jgi:hypothetical protein
LPLQLDFDDLAGVSLHVTKIKNVNWRVRLFNNKEWGVPYWNTQNL